MANVIIVSGLAFGDEGKGTTVDFLARALPNVHTVVRANGGAQAAHNVVTSDGRHHTFAQFASASFVPGVRTHHSRFMLVSPAHLLFEARDLHGMGVENLLGRLTIEEESPLIMPWNRAANWLRELARGAGQHGTCGMGIAETMQDVLSGASDLLYAGDLCNAMVTSRKAYQLRRRKQAELASLIAELPKPWSERAVTAVQALTDEETMSIFLRHCHELRRRVQIVNRDHLGTILHQEGTVIFEGAQGVLLDEWHGFHPHTTWSTTTFENPLTLLSEQSHRETVTRVGVLRAYSSRHGAGPLVTFDPTLTGELPEPHNPNTGWPGDFRVGWFDLVAARYSLKVTGGANALSLTCLDRLAHLSQVPVCVSYKYHGPASNEELSRYFEEVSLVEGRPHIMGLRVDGSHDLDRQAALTAILFHCRPQYVMVKRTQLVEFLEHMLGVPISITSYGPTANHKSFTSFPPM